MADVCSGCESFVSGLVSDLQKKITSLERRLVEVTGELAALRRGKLEEAERYIDEVAGRLGGSGKSDEGATGVTVTPLKVSNIGQGGWQLVKGKKRARDGEVGDSVSPKRVRGREVVESGPGEVVNNNRYQLLSTGSPQVPLGLPVLDGGEVEGEAEGSATSTSWADRVKQGKKSVPSSTQGNSKGKDVGGSRKGAREADASKQDKVGKQATRGLNQQVLLVGDSIVREADRAFCGKDRTNRVRVCLPGAKIRDLNRLAKGIVGRAEKGSVAVLHVGFNDVMRSGTEAIVEEMGGLIDTYQGLGMKVSISAMLPTRHKKYNSRILSLNCRIEQLCQAREIQFIDSWGKFWGKGFLYQVDGVHLNRRGADILGGYIARTLESQGTGRA